MRLSQNGDCNFCVERQSMKNTVICVYATSDEKDKIAVSHRILGTCVQILYVANHCCYDMICPTSVFHLLRAPSRNICHRGGSEIEAKQAITHQQHCNRTQCLLPEKMKSNNPVYRPMRNLSERQRIATFPHLGESTQSAQ